MRNPFVQPAIIFASDFNGIACGSLFVRHCEWSLRFLDAADLCGELVANDPDGHGNKREQNTIKHFAGKFCGFEKSDCSCSTATTINELSLPCTELS